MVDAALRSQPRIETVECAVLRKADGRADVGVLQYARLGEDAVYLVGLVDVEIACENHGGTIGNLFNLAHHKACSLTAGHLAHMVHVQVEEIEFLRRQRVNEFAPGADADAGGIPA